MKMIITKMKYLLYFLKKLFAAASKACKRLKVLNLLGKEIYHVFVISSCGLLHRHVD